MKKTRISLCLLLVLALMAGQLVARGSRANFTTHAMKMASMHGCINAQQLRAILMAAIAAWPVPNNYTYSTLRSAYNHGTLVIAAHATIPLAYYVTYDGITICVTIPL